MNPRGFSLVETLVALAVVSYGAICAAGLQIEIRHAHREAAQRALAARLAHELAGHLRSGSAATLPLYLSRAPLGRGSLGAQPQPECGTDAPCSEEQFAVHERWSYEQQLDGAAERISGAAAGGLVAPSACVSGPTGGGDGIYTVTLAWRGAVALPDESPAGCGRDPQPDGGQLYSRHVNDNALRRTLSVSIAITAPRGT